MMKPVRRGTIVAALLLTLIHPAAAANLTARMQQATPQGPGDPLGTITITTSDEGTLFRLSLRRLPPGQHGFHVHEDGECGPTLNNGIRIPAGAAGRIWDPELTGKHAGPAGEGYLGDLPIIEAGADGTVSQTLTAPRIKDIDKLAGRALVIQSGGDTYRDEPVRDGGGGLRLACGVIQ